MNPKTISSSLTHQNLGWTRWIRKKLNPAITADAGMVMNQARMMFLATPHRTADIRLAGADAHNAGRNDMGRGNRSAQQGGSQDDRGRGSLGTEGMDRPQAVDF